MPQLSTCWLVSLPWYSPQNTIIDQIHGDDKKHSWLNTRYLKQKLVSKLLLFKFTIPKSFCTILKEKS